MPSPTVGILSVALLRSYSLVRSDIWVFQYGEQFRVERQRLGNQITPRQREQLYADNGGAFFPFGIKGHRLRKWARSDVLWQRVARSPLLLVRQLWRYQVFCPILCVLIVIVAWDGRSAAGHGFTPLFIAAVILVVNSLLLSAEAALSYLKIGSWGRTYHGITVAEQKSIEEFKALFGAGMVLYLASWCLLFLVARSDLNAFPDMSSSSPWDTLGSSAYYSFALLAQFDTPSAESGLAMTSNAVIELSGAAIALGVIGMVINSIQHGISTSRTVNEPSTETEASVRSRRWRGAALAAGTVAVALIIHRHR